MINELDRQAAIELLRENRERLLGTVAGFSDDAFTKRPAESCWSPAEVFEHIVTVEGRALGRVQGALKEPADPSRKSVMAGRDEELWAGVRSPATKVSAPPVLAPSGAKDREQLVAEFTKAREATIQFAAETEADLRAHFAAHPLFGDLDCYQWLMLIPSHCERHRKQMEACGPSASAE